MRKTSRAIAGVIIATGIIGGAYAFFGSPLVPTAQATWKEHPILQKANVETKAAIAELKDAPTDFHGHRADAIKALQGAMKEMAICAEVKTEPDPAPRTLASYPHLDAAKVALGAALDYVKNAPHDFNGHRADAQKAIEDAIAQIDICLKNG